MEDKSPGSPGAGWYRTAEGTARYWDGQAWTDQERPLSSELPLSSEPPLSPERPQSSEQQASSSGPPPATGRQHQWFSISTWSRRRRRGRLGHWLIALVIVAVLVVGIFALGTVHGLRPSLAAPGSPASSTASTTAPGSVAGPGAAAAPAPLGAPAGTPGLSEATAGCVNIERELPLLAQVSPALTAIQQFETAAVPIEAANRTDSTVWAPLASDVDAVIKDLEGGNSTQLRVDSVKAEQDCR